MGVPTRPTRRNSPWGQTERPQQAVAASEKPNHGSLDPPFDQWVVGPTWKLPTVPGWSTGLPLKQSLFRAPGNPVEAIIPETVRPRRQILKSAFHVYNDGCRGVYRCVPRRRLGELGRKYRVVLERRLHSPPSGGVSLRLGRQVRSSAVVSSSSGTRDRDDFVRRRYRGCGCGTQPIRAAPDVFAGGRETSTLGGHWIVDFGLPLRLRFAHLAMSEPECQAARKRLLVAQVLIGSLPC